MGTELQTLNDRIAERIGKELIDLIPKEQWQAIVDSEVIKFRTATAPSIINGLLKEEYTKQARLAVDALIQTDEWRDISQTHTSVALTKLIGESGGEIFAAVLSPAMAMVMGDLRNRLQYT